MSELINAVFFVSDGPAVCPECFMVLGDEDRTMYRPVLADGTGDDGCGLVCDCGETWPQVEE